MLPSERSTGPSVSPTPPTISRAANFDMRAPLPDRKIGKTFEPRCGMYDELQLHPPRPNTPQVSNWGVFGDDDQLGPLNYLTPAAVLRGVSTVRTGERYTLNPPLDEPTNSSDKAPIFKPDSPAYKRVTHRQCKVFHGLVVSDDHVTFG